MSYGFNLLFVQQSFETEGQALKYGMDLVKSIAKSKDLAEAQITLHPWTIMNRLKTAGVSWTGRDDMITTMRDVSAVRLTIESSVEVIFKQRMLYWPQHKLLAILGDCIPDALKADKHNVYFQNSCDQDYDFSEWSDQITLFRDEKAAVMNMTAQELRGSNEDMDDTDLDYLRRHALYGRVFKQLHLDNWLYHTAEEQGYTSLCLSGITCPEQMQELTQRVKLYVRTNRAFICI